MKDGMREMMQWCDVMIQEDAQVENSPEEENKMLKEHETETEAEAAPCGVGGGKEKLSDSEFQVSRW